MIYQVSIPTQKGTLDDVLLPVVLPLFIYLQAMTFDPNGLDRTLSRASPAPSLLQKLGVWLSAKMSLESVKKVGYLSKLPVKGLVKVSVTSTSLFS